ncbi:portal vertex protein GpQ [Pantoea agglomerans]|nr:portal vertex protein GpQ [Pantoea agglomerans]
MCAHALDQLQLNTDKANAPQQHAEAFTFGDPMLVMDKRDILDYAECISNGRWFEPPAVLTRWLKACARPYITARRFT